MERPLKTARPGRLRGQSHSIYKRMLVLIACFFFIPFLASGVYWYNEATRVIENKAVEHGQQLVDFMNEHLNAYFEQLEVTTSSLLTSPILKSYLSKTSYDEFDKYDFTQRVSNELFSYILSNRGDIQNISIVGDNGLVASSFSYQSAVDAYEAYADKDVRGENFSIVGIRWINTTPVLTIMRNLINNTTYRSEGYLILDIKYSTIADLMQKMSLGKSGRLWVYDEKGEIIYHADPENWGKPMKTVFPDIPLLSGKDSRIDRAEEGKTLTVYDRLDVAGWEVANRVPLDELAGKLNSLSTMTGLIGAFLAALALAVMWIILFILTRSIKSLQRLMKKAEIGDLEVRAPNDHPTVEIASLYRSFNSMVDEINRLVGAVETAKLKEKEMELRQMESRLLLMQAQINPHFLYNTLEIVNSYAIEAGVKQVSRMVIAIAHLFRYNMRDLLQKVTLAEELEHLKTYLSIQRERYAGLEVDMELDEDAVGRTAAVRLALQPIVENCFKHGYGKRSGKPMWIGIRGRAADGAFRLTVCDRGVGMDGGQAAAWNARFAETDPEKTAESFRQGEHIGMWNVHHRIRLAFGTGFGLHIVRSDGTGTEIDITLPREGRDDESADRGR